MTTTFPLPTLGATIDSTGVHSPTYSDIYQSLIASYQGIYGSDIYVPADSQDGQALAVHAKAIYDTNQNIIAVYNSWSPSTAQGAALSSVVKINGIKRNSYSYSTVDLLIVGQAGAKISSGVAFDGTYKWSLPTNVIIPVGGSITVSAACQTAGAISAVANSINRIYTPTFGWQSVNNPLAAVPGAPVEDDPTLRARQTVSTAIPSRTVIDGITGAILNITGVTACVAHENDTKTTDSSGVPGNSIAMIVNGGDPIAIATVISNKKTPGSTTYGTTTEVVTNASGVPVTINFYRPTIVNVLVAITIKALTGYVSTTGTAVQAAIASYINSLGIGGGNGKNVSYDGVYSAAKSVTNGNTFSIQSLAITGGTPDLAILFNQLPSCTSSNVTLTVV